MSKDFNVYEKEEKTFSLKFNRLMDLLVTNKSSSRMETIILISISFLQILSGFYSEDVGLFTESSGVPDSYLQSFKTIVRIKDLFKNNFEIYQIVMYMILVILSVLTIAFFLILLYNEKNSFYSFKEMIINSCLKCFVYVLFSPILDLSLAIFCFEDTNPNFSNLTCSLTASPALTVICVIVISYSIFISFVLSLYYNDSLFLSNSCFARISCNYEVYHTLNVVLFAFFLFLTRYFGTLIFFIYNIFFSLFFMRFLFEKYPFYNSLTSFLIGTFHSIYAWTSIFGVIFFYLDVKQKSILYACGIVLTIFLYTNLKTKLEDDIILRTPFHKITNKNHFLFYIKSLLDKINNVDNVLEDKAQLIGIIKMHALECPLSDCITKKRDKIEFYLPVTEEWSNRNIPETSDKVFMSNFIVYVLNFFFINNYYSPDTLMNISAYYLIIIGNYCQAMIYQKKVSEMKLSTEESFSYFRTKILISKALVEKLKPSNENIFDLEEVNTTMYFKYDDLSQKFFEEINNDINLNLEFWKIFKEFRESNERLDFNKVFSLTDRIRLTKNKIEKIWEELFETYNGFNDLFDLYENYIEQINDDGALKAELTGVKNKIISNNEHFGIRSNFYNILFSKDTGIFIVSGDKGKEGMIEKANSNIEQFFGFQEEELKGMSINFLMPKIFEKQHKNFIERYTAIGEKRIIDKTFVTYGKDKRNSLIPLTNRIKLFPMLGDYICFCAMMIKETGDDIVLLDSKFNIQGMSRGLIDKFKLNDNIFQDSDIPFYLICNKFINHYKLFMLKSKESDSDGMFDFQKMENIEPNKEILSSNANLLGNYEKENNNIYNGETYEISENAELEFEIKIPFLLKTFVSNFAKKENNINFTSMVKTHTNISEEDEEQNKIEIITEKSVEDEEPYDESQELMNQDTYTYTHDPPTQSGISSKNSNNKLIVEEDKEFQNKINYYRNFFEKKQFDQLENEIEKLNTETKESDLHKFIFTLNAYRYGDNNISYVVRCIDNKEETDLSLNSEVKDYGQNNDNPNAENLHVQKKKILFTDMKEITKEDQEEIKKVLGEYYKLSKEDENYFTELDYYREEILNSSRIFGLKKMEIEIDESSSQTGQNSYSDNLSKKAKIEEIKASMMKTVSDFYTLKTIKATFVAFIFITILFAFIYILVLDNLFNDSLTINQLDTIFYVNTFTMTNFISSLVSMRSLFEILMLNENVTYNVFTNPKDSSNKNSYEEYFDFHKDLSYTLSDLIKAQNSYMECNFTKYLPDYSFSFYWDKIYAGFNFLQSNNNNNLIGYPLALAKSLIQAESLLGSDLFNISNSDLFNFTSISKENLDHYEFSSFYAIENAYNTLLPHQITLLNEMDGFFENFNSSNLENVKVIIICYSIFIILLSFIYVTNLYLTNKNMQQALQKTSRISLEKIDDIIKRIEYFNEKVLSKYKQEKGFDSGKGKNNIDEKDDPDKNKENSNNEENKKDEKTKNNIEKYSFEEQNKTKDLAVLNSSYLQVCLILSLSSVVIFAVYFLSYNMITTANNFLQIKKFIFGDLIITSTNILSTKCVVSECKVNSDLFYDNSLDSKNKQNIIIQIKNYPELDKFYNNRYLLSICDTLYKDDYVDAATLSSSSVGMDFYNDMNGITLAKMNDTVLNEEFNKCIADTTIKSANNTESLVKSIFDSIFAINKEIQIKKNIIKHLYGGVKNDPNSDSNSIPDEYNLKKAYESFYFREMEYIYYNFIMKLPVVCDKVFIIALYNYMQDVRGSILILIIFYTIIMIVFSLYIIFGFIQTLIHLLSISRCILKIIPTYVINNTPELEQWLENKF